MAASAGRGGWAVEVEAWSSRPPPSQASRADQALRVEVVRPWGAPPRPAGPGPLPGRWTEGRRDDQAAANCEDEGSTRAVLGGTGGKMRRSETSPEEVIAYLLYWACIDIRHLAARGRNATASTSTDPDDNYYERIRLIADACHNLPILLGTARRRARRRAAVRRLEYLWKSASDEQLVWLHTRLDRINYDYAELDAIRAKSIEELRAAGLLV
jgi:hypothetical protein